MKPAVAIVAAALLLAGCAGKTTSPSTASPSSGPPPAAPSSMSLAAATTPRLLALVTSARAGLWKAYLRGRDGASVKAVVGDYGSLRPVPSTATSALKRYIRFRRSSHLDAVNSLAALKGGLADAYDNGREGKPFEASPSIYAALQRALDAHPGTANKASRVTIFYCSGRPGATTRRAYIDVLFWAEGARMWAAGQMAPGLNDVVFFMTRSAAGLPWQRVGVAPVG